MTATTTTDFYIKPSDGWVAVASAATMNIIKGPPRTPWFLYCGASPPSTSDTPASVNLSYTGQPTGAIKATGALTFEDDTGAGDKVANNEVVVIGSRTYTFKTALTGAANEVLIGAHNTNAAANLVAAINGAAGAGTTYGTGTVANDTFVASLATLVLTITALLNGTAANGKVTTTTSAGAAWGAGTTASGTVGDNITLAGVVYTMVAALSQPLRVAGNLPGEVLVAGSSDLTYANLESAVNGAAGAGTAYGIGTTSHPSNIGATLTSSSDDLLFAAGPSDNGIAVSEALTNASFDGALTALAGGAPAPKGMGFSVGGLEDSHEIALPGLTANAYVRLSEHRNQLADTVAKHFSVIAITA